MVSSVNFFQLANRQAQWLAVRQGVIAGNIANVNTPGYHSRDVADFSTILQNKTVSMITTDPHHMDVGGDDMGVEITASGRGAEVTHSDNNVNLEEEVRQGGALGRDMALNVSLVKAFHRMLMASVRNGG
ncbi:flagellar basal body protein [Bartonella sp. DGB2]|uniref:flagellar basal body protein n=1 Tax=Bartonella sp. DGB2 TaxID=3388426 RepID=UPI00398FF3C2